MYSCTKRSLWIYGVWESVFYTSFLLSCSLEKIGRKRLLYVDLMKWLETSLQMLSLSSSLFRLVTFTFQSWSFWSFGSSSHVDSVAAFNEISLPFFQSFLLSSSWISFPTLSSNWLETWSLSMIFPMNRNEERRTNGTQRISHTKNTTRESLSANFPCCFQ